MHAKDNSRSGIALIITLGMLAVMMTLGVAFVVAMRTERVAAGYFTEVMKARHLTYTALARAMRDLEQDMEYYNCEGYPQWETNYPSYVNAMDLHTNDSALLIPQGLINTVGKLASPGRVSEPEAGDSAGRLRDENAGWAPGGVLGFANPWIEIMKSAPTQPGATRTFGTITGNGDQWLDVDVDEPFEVGDYYRIARPQWSPVGSLESNVGWVAYLVLNVSGLLDANEVGQSPEKRGGGASPSEIVLSDLPEVRNISALMSHRNSADNGYYERMSDFTDGNSGLNGSPRSFYSYSRFPADMLPGDSFAAPVDISSTDLNADDLKARKDDIVNAFAWSITADPSVLKPSRRDLDDALELYNNLIDFVDEDNVPGSGSVDGGTTLGPYVDRAPMINEIFVTNSLNIDASGNITGRSEAKVSLECWYPFLTIDPRPTFTLEYDVEFVPTGSTPSNIFPAGPITVTRDLNAVEFPFITSRHRVLAGATNPPSQSIRYDLHIRNAHVKEGSDEVDRIPDRTLRVVVPAMPAGQVWVGGQGEDVLDPRFNWTAQHWDKNPVYPYKSSVGYVNRGTTNFIASNTMQGSFCDIDTKMYIANRPLLSVGELAYIFAPGSRRARFPVNVAQPAITHAQPWRTLRPYDAGSGYWARFFDYFTMTNAPVLRGMVNPNSEVPDVLAAVYNKMRIDEYPEEASPALAPLDWNQATNVAHAILTYTSTTNVDRVSGLGSAAMSSALFTAAGVGGGSEFRKESVYRNAHGLFHTRQNLFVILLAGRSNIRVEQRALAVVWRDPVADADGHHPSYIRWFTWLEK